VNLHIHLGAHKTGTTHLQELLNFHQTDLKNQGILYIPLLELRAKLTDIYSSKSITKPLDFYQYVIERSSGFTKVILSEENLMGNTNNIFNQRELYQNNLPFLSILSELIKRSEVKLFFSVRNLATFLPSIYSEALNWSSYQPFEKTYHSNFLNLSWMSVIAKLQSLNRPLFLWKYEDYKEHCKEILREISFDSKVDWQEHKVPMLRRSSSKNLMKCYEEISTQLGGDHRKIYRLLREYFPITKQEDRFEPFAKVLTDHFDQSYQRDISSIKSCDGIEFYEAKRDKLNLTIER